MKNDIEFKEVIVAKKLHRPIASESGSSDPGLFT